MKICHVSFARINGEPERWLKSIPYHTRVLERLARRHAIVSFHFSSRSQTIERNGVVYHFMRAGFLEYTFLISVIAAVRREAPGMIVLHGMHAVVKMALFVRALGGIRVVVQHHGERVFAWPKAWLQKYNDRFVAGYFFSSSEMGAPWVERKIIASRDKIIQILEATSSFEPSPRANPNDELSFLWVGRIDQNKDPDTLIDAFKDFLEHRPDAKLFIISKDESRLRLLHSRIGDASRSIRVVGSVAHHLMMDWFSNVNFIVSTSLFEGSGIAVLEAMSAGCIPILSDIPSFRTITGRGEVGMLFEPASARELTKALLRAQNLKVADEQKRVIDYFCEHLSANAIAIQIENSLLRLNSERSQH
ncbi:MAG TPA: glycosyltransferase family 4 protein [Chryseosolibacter sp.]